MHALVGKYAHTLRGMIYMCGFVFFNVLSFKGLLKILYMCSLSQPKQMPPSPSSLHPLSLPLTATTILYPPMILYAIQRILPQGYSTATVVVTVHHKRQRNDAMSPSSPTSYTKDKTFVFGWKNAGLFRTSQFHTRKISTNTSAGIARPLGKEVGF